MRKLTLNKILIQKLERGPHLFSAHLFESRDGAIPLIPINCIITALRYSL
jgi:hypothetical protein